MSKYTVTDSSVRTIKLNNCCVEWEYRIYHMHDQENDDRDVYYLKTFAPENLQIGSYLEPIAYTNQYLYTPLSWYNPYRSILPNHSIKKSTNLKTMSDEEFICLVKHIIDYTHKLGNIDLDRSFEEFELAISVYEKKNDDIKEKYRDQFLKSVAISIKYVNSVSNKTEKEKLELLTEHILVDIDKFKLCPILDGNDTVNIAGKLHEDFKKYL